MADTPVTYTLTPPDADLGASYTALPAAGTDLWQIAGRSIVCAVKSTYSCGTTNYEVPLTLTNNAQTVRTLRLDYTTVLSGGIVIVDYTPGESAPTAEDSTEGTGTAFSKALSPGESVQIYVKSGSSDTATEVYLDRVYLIGEKLFPRVTFQSAEHGSYTVDGTEVTGTYETGKSGFLPWTCAAEADPGYRFIAWTGGGQVLGTEPQLTFWANTDMTVRPVFAAENRAAYLLGSTVYESLSAALTAAESGDTVTVLASGVVGAGSYTVGPGVTLCLPCDARRAVLRAEPAPGGTAYAEPYGYTTLALAPGAQLTVQGEVSVAARACCGGKSCGAVSGAYAMVYLSGGSQITVADGGSLYAWGYVCGSGSVRVLSGGTVYEWMQLADFRGGNNSAAMSNKVFPFNQYYIQNVEAPLTAEYGARVAARLAVYANGKGNTSNAELIGAAGLFRITQAGGTITKTYDPARDRVNVDIQGQAELNALTVKLAGTSLNSGSYVLPITGNMTIRVVSGKTVQSGGDVCLLPGSRVYIAPGAEFEIAAKMTTKKQDDGTSTETQTGNSLYAYGRTEWLAGDYAFWGAYVPCMYSPTRTYRRGAEDLTDAEIEAEGTLTAHGWLYETESGAHIHGGGTLVKAGGDGAAALTYQYTGAAGGQALAEIPVKSAVLAADSGE